MLRFNGPILLLSWDEFHYLFKRVKEETNDLFISEKLFKYNEELRIYGNYNA